VLGIVRKIAVADEDDERISAFAPSIAEQRVRGNWGRAVDLG
jgi:hypothetical protein